MTQSFDGQHKNTATSVQYPEAFRDDLVEKLPESAPSVTVADPYRWLEDSKSTQTATWMAAQDELFANVSSSWAGQPYLEKRLGELLAAGLETGPIWRGDRYFFMRRTADQEHAVLWVCEDGSERVLIDPMELDSAGTTTLDTWQPSKEGNLLAYQVSQGGTEEATLYVLDVASGDIVDGPIDRTRYSQVAWLPGESSFIYSRRVDPSLVPADEVQFHRRVWWHKLGTPADQDVELFGAGRPITSYYGTQVSMDGQWLITSAARGTDPQSDVYLSKLPDGDTLDAEAWQGVTFDPIIEGVDAQTSAQLDHQNRLWIYSDLDAPRGRLFCTDVTKPTRADWQVVIDERDDAVLAGFDTVQDTSLAGGEELVVAWTTHAVSEITRHDPQTGEKRGEVTVPAMGTITGVHNRPEGGPCLWFMHSDFVTPATALQWDCRSGEITTWASPPGSVEVPKVRTDQVEYTSIDGTTVRMFVCRREDLVSEDGESVNPAPTILYGYGGFTVSLTPAFSAAAAAWVEAGGTYVVASLRGGSEEGEAWHRDGMLGKKQNVFDDFLSAADHLCAEGLTTASQLAISGGSNGGLLVGAAVTQAPEKFAAVVCSAPLLDMVRYQLHGLGESWIGEYGDATQMPDLEWLHAYSPYHRVVKDAHYPAVMFQVYEGDTRVDPLHARKLCAAMQWATSGDAPIVIRQESEVGHGGRAVSKTIGVTVHSLAFIAAATGLTWPQQ